MESPHSQSCIDCVLRPDRLFCDLPADALEAFDSIKSIVTLQPGEFLFRETQPARAMFVLCEGRVKISVCSDTGKRLTLRVAGPGEVLGLSAALSGARYEVSAEAIDAARIAVVKRKELLVFLRQYREACMHVVHMLSEDLHYAYDRVRAIGLARTRKLRYLELQ